MSEENHSTLAETKERNTAFKLPDPTEVKEEAATKVVEPVSKKVSKKEATIQCTLCTRKYCYNHGLERHMREAHAGVQVHSTQSQIPSQLPSKIIDNNVGPEVKYTPPEPVEPAPRKMQDPLPSAPQPRALPPQPAPKPSYKVAKAGRWF